MFWFYVQLLSEIFLILRTIRRDIGINVKILHIKYPLFMSAFNETWIFSTYVRRKTQVLIFVKIRPMGAELFHTGGHTDRQIDRHDEANARFSQFSESV